MTGKKKLFSILGRDRGLLATLIGSVFSATALIVLIIAISIIVI